MRTLSRLAIVSVATFGPAYGQIPKANLWAHYSAENGVNGSATPLPDKTVVTKWNDISGNNRHLTRTDTGRPAVVANNAGSCGVTGVYFKDGYVYSSPGDAGFTSPLTGDKTIFVVGKANTGATRGYFFDGRPTTGQLGRTALFAGQNSCPTDWTVYIGGQGTIGCGQTSPIAFDRYLVHSIVLAKDRQEHYVGGKLVSKGTYPAAGSIDALILGARINGILRMNGYITHMAVYSKAMSSAERTVVEKILTNLTPLGYSEAYGAGCADSSSNTGVLRGSSCVRTPGSFSLSLTRGTASSVGVILLGTGRTNIPIFARSRNCVLLAGPPWFLSLASATDVTGSFTLGPIPLPAGLEGIKFTSQVAVLDPNLADRFSFSNGVEFHVEK